MTPATLQQIGAMGDPTVVENIRVALVGIDTRLSATVAAVYTTPDESWRDRVYEVSTAVQALTHQVENLRAAARDEVRMLYHSIAQNTPVDQKKDKKKKAALEYKAIQNLSKFSNEKSDHRVWIDKFINAMATIDPKMRPWFRALNEKIIQDGRASDQDVDEMIQDAGLNDPDDGRNWIE